MKDETALITGSTNGIGKKTAELFLREGCKVMICSRKEEHVKNTLTEFKEKFGDSVIGLVCDVSDPSDVKSIVEETIKIFGSLRILVANAGINLEYGPFEYIPYEKVNIEAKSVIETNLIGTINSISAVLPHMIDQGYGRIVTLGGGGADRPIEHMTIYSASKGGVLAFSRCLAQEISKKEIDLKINVFFPGMIDTNLTNTAQVIEAWKDRETFEREFELIRKYVMTDIEESCRNIIPYVLPKCKDNGKTFRGFSLMKLIKGFKRIRKEMKMME